MASVDRFASQANSTLAAEIAAVVERLRRVTVQVRGGRGGGAGVLWRSDSPRSHWIITNAHVTHGPRVELVLPDGHFLYAEVRATDSQRDLAALSVPAAGLPAAEIGDSGGIRVGELVLAVGNPWGLVGAVAAGIVHAIGPIYACHGPSCIQADVRLAPGNSGGPLADARGRVIGINSMVAGGLALAIPSNEVERFLRGLGSQCGDATEAA